MRTFKDHLQEGTARFTVDYMYLHKNGAWHRQRVSSTNLQLPGQARSETAIQSFLKRKHPGSEINIITVDWE